MLLEREHDLAALGAQWERARAGHGGLALVVGEAGAGKSSLLQAFTAGLDAGVAVLWGACDPLTTPRPLGPLHDLADQLGEATRAALDDERPPHEIFAAVTERLRAAPTVLVVDDLHWADQGTIDLLRFVLRRIGGTASLVLGALRDDEVGAAHPLRALLGDVARSPDATSRGLRPLSIEAIATLAGDRAVDLADLHARTGGNPFFVGELLDHAGDELPLAVRDAVLARTAHLDADAWDLLHLLACAPEAIPDHLLARLHVGLLPLRAVDEAGLVQRGRRGLAFRHDLCRTVLAGTVPPGGAAAMHRRMLDALEATPGADPAVLAHHAVGAGDAEAIVRHASTAARAAARSGAHTQAEAFYRSALGQGVALEPSVEAQLLEGLAAECYLVDRLDDAIAASERAMRLREQVGDQAGVSVNHHALAIYHWYNADRRVADGHASEAVTVLEDADAPEAAGPRGHGLAMQAYLALQSSDLEGARSLLARAGGVAGDALDPSLGVRVGVISGICSLVEGDAAARDALLAALAAAPDGLDEILSSGWSNLSAFDIEQRRLDEAAAVLEVSLPFTFERDLPVCRVWQLGTRGRLRLLEGDWEGAADDVARVLGGPGAPLARVWPLLVRGLVRLRGDEPGAARDLDEAWALAQRYGEPVRLLPTAAALAEQAWLTGADDPRLDDARRLLAEVHGAGLSWARGELASWLWRLDPTVTADDIAEPYRRLLAGDAAGAAAWWSSPSLPFERALALVATGRDGEVRAGLDLLDRMGAVAVAAKVRRDLRRDGAAVVPAKRRAATRANHAGLTNRELEVLHLLGDNLTNAELAERLYISAKTVDHHVSSILAKLQVGSRREAVRAARELGLAGV